MMDPKLEKNRKNYLKAFGALEEALSTPSTTKKEIAGVIQHFEFVYELSWKTLKTYLENQGITCQFPRDTFEKAFQSGVIQDPTVWAKMMDDRNLSVHTYNEKLAQEVLGRITSQYFGVFKKLSDFLATLRN